MTTTQIDVKDRVVDLSTESFQTFWNDIADMFSLQIKCTKQKTCEENIETIGKRFEKLVAVSSIKAEGPLNGTFQIVFDRAGLFILSSVIVMMPEKIILEQIQHGSLKEAEQTKNNLTEVGDLLAGAWTRVFQEEPDTSFVQNDTFVGTAWDNPEESLSLSTDAQLVFISYQVTVGPYPAFNCGIIFSKKMFEPSPESDTNQPVSAEQTSTEEQTEQQEKQQDGQETKEQVTEEAENEEDIAPVENAEPEEKKPRTVEAGDTNENTSEEHAELSDEADKNKEQVVSETILEAAPSDTGLQAESAGTASAVCAKDIMHKDVLWAGPDDSVQQILTKMQQTDAGYILIGRDGQLEGIVSKSDSAGAVSPYLRPVFAKWHRPQDDATLQIKVKWIMSRPVRTIKPDTPLPAIMENMGQFGGRCLPVIDQQGKIQGLVTVFDIFKALLKSNWNITTTGKTPQSPTLV